MSYLAGRSLTVASPADAAQPALDVGAAPTARLLVYGGRTVRSSAATLALRPPWSSDRGHRSPGRSPERHRDRWTKGYGSRTRSETSSGSSSERSRRSLRIDGSLNALAATEDGLSDESSAKPKSSRATHHPRFERTRTADLSSRSMLSGAVFRLSCPRPQPPLVCRSGGRGAGTRWTDRPRSA